MSDRIDEWQAHVRHLAAALGYVRGCYVCEMGEGSVDSGVSENQRWYSLAQRSKRVPVPLAEVFPRRSKVVRSSAGQSSYRIP